MIDVTTGARAVSPAVSSFSGEAEDGLVGDLSSPLPNSAMEEGVPTKMRAIEFRRIDGGGGTLTLQADRPVPAVGPGLALLRVAYAGVCGSDLHILDGTSSYADKVVLGHEMAGWVVALGAECDEEKEGRGDKKHNSYCGDVELRVGMAVSMCPQFSCGVCSLCCSGRPNFCSAGGYESTVGYYSNGCFAEYVVVHQSQVRALPHGLSMEKAVLCEPFNCLLNGVKKLGKAIDNGNGDGDGPSSVRAVILGGGIFGLLWCAVLHSHGVRNITLAEPKAGRLQIAQKYLSSAPFTSVGVGVSKGDDIDFATNHRVGGSSNCGARAVHPDLLTGNKTDVCELYDVAIECCGEATAVEIAYQLLDVGGSLLVFGGPPRGSSITLDPSTILFKELTIKGSVIGQDTFETGIECLCRLDDDGYIDFGMLGIETFLLEQYMSARDKLVQGDICKAVFRIREK